MQYYLLMMVLAEYSSSYVLSVCLLYDVGDIYFDLAQTQQHFQTIVQLTHARPTMSCIHLVLIVSTWYVMAAISTYADKLFLFENSVANLSKLFMKFVLFQL